MIININTEKKYNIEIKKHLLDEIGVKLLSFKRLSKVCIITDVNVHPLYTKQLTDSLSNTGFEVHKIVFDNGEATKSFEHLEQIVNYLADEGFTKSDLLIALGGGVIGDLTGFAASIYQRGMDYIQIPTTLLSAVDSSMGGKTAINLHAGKNLVGTFWQPKAVYFDTATLETLSKKELQNGLSEIIKAGVILDKTILNILDKHQPSQLGMILEDLIIKAIEVKKKIIEIDERESGIRQVLNLGHTMGHAIEKCSNFNIAHGQAVAIGLLSMTRIAETKGWSEEYMSDYLAQIYKKYQFDLFCKFTYEQLAKASYADKKRHGDMITLAIPKALGQCTLKEIHCSNLEELFKIGLGE